MRDVIPHLAVAIAFAVAGARVARVHVPKEAGSMNEHLAHEAWLEITDKEGDARQRAAYRFQGSPWSQQDDFHGSEKGAVRSFVQNHHVSLSSVVNALDRGMREKWPTHPDVVVSQRVIPCRPRLAY